MEEKETQTTLYFGDGELLTNRVIPLEVNKNTLQQEKEKYVDENAIENSPMLKKIANFCFKKNGCYKFFDPKIDYEFLSPEDYLISFGDDAGKSIEYFRKMGYQFKDMSPGELDNTD
ncbi:MAG: hypothetical protein AABY10_02900 [Nanoarchaeota archaeon]